jgi:hypothetical protein
MNPKIFPRSLDRQLGKMERRAVSRVANYDISHTQAWHWTVKSNIIDLYNHIKGTPLRCL